MSFIELMPLGTNGNKQMKQIKLMAKDLHFSYHPNDVYCRR